MIGAPDFAPLIADGSAPGSLVSIVRRPPAGEPPSAMRVVWSHDAGDAAGARNVLAWLRGRPERWDYWGWLATSFGGEVLVLLIVEEVEDETRRQADEEALKLAKAEKKLRMSRQIDIYLHDGKRCRPALSLESADQDKPFWKISFAERWERDRVYDWVRWQRERFLDWRDLVACGGMVALERLVMAGMRETERDVKARGLAHPSRRPLRFWAGE